jgi:CubicO group peptidase (beta-lactamase class C family)
VFSVSKTFISVAIGIARAEGLLDLDDPVADHAGDPEDFLSTPLVAEPGSTYAYRGTNSYVLGQIIEQPQHRDPDQADANRQHNHTDNAGRRAPGGAAAQLVRTRVGAAH